MRNLKALCSFAACGLALCAAPPAAAQTGGWEDSAFINVNFAIQPAARPFTDALTPVIYGQAASVEATHPVAGGPLPVEVAGGMRLVKSFGVGVSYTSFALTDIVDVAAQVPYPVVSPLRRAASATAEVAREDTAIHLLALWVTPVTDHVDVAFSGGPSLIWLKQDRVSGIAIEEDSPTFATVKIAEVALAPYEERVLGFHAGVDVTYFMTPMVGIGGMVRFVRGSSGSSGGTAINVGGLQMGFGARVRVR